ncbi:MAG: O-antigen ligase family protein [Prevotellaceae bacterium]|jgi:O-antigen ligase|nr:O-antigen ligase family protein [Prevotellaceae bacterium]
MKHREIVISFLQMIPFFLVFSTVFIISRQYLSNGVISGKYFWFYASMGVLNVIVLAFTLSRKLYFKFTVFDFLVLLFSGSTLFSSLVINDASQNTTKFVLFVLLLVLYFNFRLFTNHEELKTERFFFLFMVFTGFVEAVWGLCQLYGFVPSQHSLYKITGSFFNPGPFAGYLAVVFPLALHYGVKSEELRMKIFFDNTALSRYLFKYKVLKNFCVSQTIGAITCIAILLVLPSAMSRASWLAAITGGLIVLTTRYSTSFERLKKYFGEHKKKTALVGMVAGILLFTAFSGMYFLKKESADGRTLIWKIALQTAKEHPLGVGLGNFSGAYGDAQSAYFAAGKGTAAEELVAGSPIYGFNEYLQIMVECGVISLLLFLSIVFLSLRSFFINRKWGMVGSLISLLVFSFFSYPFNVLPILIIVVFLLAMGGASEKSLNFPNNLKSKYARICVICVLFPFLSVTAFCCYKEYPIYGAYKKWNAIKRYYCAGLHKDVVKDYEMLYPLLNDQIQFLFEYAQSLSKTEQYIESNEVLKRAMQISCDPMLYNIMGKNYQALNTYQEAEACFMKAAHIVPHRLYPYYLLTKLYHEMGLQDKVNEFADIVQTKEPKVHSTAIKEMKHEVKKMKVENINPL